MSIYKHYHQRRGMRLWPKKNGSEIWQECRTENQRLKELLEHSNYIDHTTRDLKNILETQLETNIKKQLVNETGSKKKHYGKQCRYIILMIIIYMELENSLIERDQKDQKRCKTLLFNLVIKKYSYTQYSTSTKRFKQDQVFGIKNQTVFFKNSQLNNDKNALISKKQISQFGQTILEIKWLIRTRIIRDKIQNFQKDINKFSRHKINNYLLLENIHNMMIIIKQFWENEYKYEESILALRVYDKDLKKQIIKIF
ncbi:unnamed protein product [Paramecium primaurelia]|uniref:Uncharacterized protein n=1 Tax=Paramecium primaurelia TaxID=5886 RepID=A0A8S1MWY9_PARPR|nr:unnamed protein product [Paramecium primaurelia]